MPYLGNSPVAGDHTNNFKVLDDISSYTETFDGSSTSIVSTSNNTIRAIDHRFIQGQRVTYTNGGGGNIGGLTTGTVYFVIFDTASTFKLATNASNAANSVAINLSSVGSGSSHTLNAAFDGVNTKFKITYNSGTAARFNNATQLNIAINNVLQKPNVSSTTFTEGFAIEDSHKIVFKVAPTNQDIFWGSIIANTLTTFDVSDHKVDTFTGDGSTTEFALSHIPTNNDSLMVTINGVLQHPSNGLTARAYTLIESIIQFTAAPGVGDEIQVRHLGFAGAITNGVTGFYGRIGNVALTSSDHITTGDITARNFKTTGITTFGAANFSGNVSIGGTLTYEDVTNIDSVGIITARKDIHVGAGVSAVGVGTFGSLDISGDIDVDGHTNLDNVSIAGVTTFSEDVKFTGATSGRDIIFDKSDNQLEFARNAKAYFGGSFPLTIYNNINSYISQSPNAALFIESKDVQIYGSGNGYNNSIFIARNGIVELGYEPNGGSLSTQLKTSAKGITVGTGVTIETNGQATFTGIITATAGIDIPAMQKISFGDPTGAHKLEIYHNTSGSSYHYIRSTSSTNHLIMEAASIGPWTDSFIVRNKSNTQNKFRIHSDGQTFLYYNNAEKLKTTNTGIDVTGGAVFSDDVSFTTANGNGIIIDKSNNSITLGNSVTQYFGGSAMWLMHNGSTGYLHNVTGSLYIRNEDSSGDIYIQGKSGENSIICNYDGNVQLYNDNVIKFNTTSTGVTVHGSADPNLTIRQGGISSSGSGFLAYENVDGNGTPRSIAKIQGKTAGNGGYGDLIFQTAFNNSLSERLRIDSLGRLIVGGGTDPAESTIVAKGNSTSATSYSVLDMRRGQAATSAGDVLGYIRFSDTNIPSSNNNYGLIFGACDGASSGAGDNPGRLVFSTTADGASGPTERLRITSTGVLNVPAGIGPQLRFENQHSVTTDAAISTFDDASGTLLCLGSNLYVDSSGSDIRYNTSEESTGIVLNRQGYINLKTGSTGATAVTRVQITETGKVQIGLPGATGNLAGGVEVVNIRAASNANLIVRNIGSLTSSPAGSGVGIDVLNDGSNTVMDLCLRGHTVIFRNRTAETLRITGDGLLLGGSDASNNTTLGGNAGDSIASGGISNTLIGKDAGTAINTGDSNTAVGYLALKTLTGNAGCVAVGSNALEVCTGSDNLGVGFAAGQQLAGGTNNCLIGSSAGLMIQEGDHNVAIGRDALRMGSNSNVNYNVVLGSNSVNQLTNAYNNVVIGYNCSGSATMTGGSTWHSNVVIGYQSGNNVPSAASNVVIGKYTCYEGGSAHSDNIVMGTEAGRYLGNSSNNCVILGQQAAYKAGYGSGSNHAYSWTHSIAIGYRAFYNATGAPDSVVAIGSQALKEHNGDGDGSSGGYIVAVGQNCMAANQHIRHTVAVGNDAGAYWNAAKGNQHEGGCVFIGGGAGRYQGTAAAIIAIGRDSLNASNSSPASGTNNTAIGARCLEKVTSGSHNVAVSALYGALFVSTGSWNTFMGSLAGYAYDTNNSCQTGNYCTQIGAYTRSSGSSNDYENVFGYGGVGKGARTFYVNNDNGVYHGGNVSSWSTTSDRRIKKNIINNNTGLDLINSIQVRNFEYKTKGEIINDNPELENVAESAVVEKEGLQLGVIAQELEKVLPDCVKTQSTGIKTVDSDNITWYLVNAVKELSAEVKSLKAQLNS